MVSLANSIIIDAPADRVWEVVAGRFDRIGEWATAIPASGACPVAAPGTNAPVAARVCYTGVALVPEVTETIMAYDGAARTLTYEATAGMPAFVTTARNRWQVTDLGGGRTRVAYAAEMHVRGVLGRLARWWLLAQVGRTGRHMLADLKHYAEHGTASPRKQRQLRQAAKVPGATVDAVAAVGVRPGTRLLRTALRANAVFSLACGVALVVAGWWLARPWGLGPAALPPLVGVAVAGFGVMVARLAVQPARAMRVWAALVIAADGLWVVGSTALLAMHPPPRPGAVAVAVVGVAVAGVAAAQIAALIAARPDDALGDMETVESSRVYAARPATVWPLLTDHDLYGRLAPNLRSVQVISEPGQPLRRRCTNTSGDAWEETCTLWEDGRRFAVEVDTTDYPYPLESMSGLWQVDPHPDGSKVTMRFAYRARPTALGGLFAIVFRMLFAPVLSRILDGWQARLTGDRDRQGISAGRGG
jgi:ribosome-associated toxin RatA of RatAB toxin-antitoxin module